MEAVMWIVGGLLVSPFVILFVSERVAVVEQRPVLPMKDLYYIRGIVRKRYNYAVNELLALELLEKAYVKGVSIEVLNHKARVCPTWDKWVVDMLNTGLREVSVVGSVPIDK